MDTRTIGQWRAAAIGRMADGAGFRHPDSYGMRALLEDDSARFGIAPSSTGHYWNPYSVRTNQDAWTRARAAVRDTRDAYGRSYRWTGPDRRRTNDALWRLAYGRRTALDDILPSVSAVHPTLAWVLEDMVLVARSGSVRVPLCGRVLVLDWYDGALEVAYVS